MYINVFIIRQYILLWEETYDKVECVFNLGIMIKDN